MLLCVREDNRIKDLIFDTPGTLPGVGSLVIGKVSRVLPGMQAAFILVAPGEECYMNLEKDKRIFYTSPGAHKTLKAGDELLVEIKKEASGLKKAAVTTNISFPGKTAIIMPGSLTKGVSSKIQGPRRTALKALLAQADTGHFGVILRTEAQKASDEDILREIASLKAECEKTLQNAPMRTACSLLRKSPPAIYKALLKAPCDAKITCEGQEAFDSVKAYMRAHTDVSEDNIVLYTDTYPLGHLLKLPTVIENALRKKVFLKHGGFLVIEQTEALNVIDVNSGRTRVGKKSLDGNLKINLEAAVMAAEEIRRRNLSGIVLIDFINMASEEEWTLLEQNLKMELCKDPVPTYFVDFTKLGLAEITRKKIRKPLNEYLERNF